MKLYFLFVGIVVFRGINTVISVPLVSIPSESGQTSNNNTSPVPLAYLEFYDSNAA